MAQESKSVTIRVPADLLAKVDAAAGQGGRTRLIVDAVRAHLDGQAPAGEPERPPAAAKLPTRRASPPKTSAAGTGPQVRWCATHERAVGAGRTKCAVGGACKVA